MTLDPTFVTLLVIGAVIASGIVGFAIKGWLQHAKESAPTRALQEINALLTVYEHLTINAREQTEVAARQAANRARYLAIEARMASLPTTAVVPATVTITTEVPKP